MINRVTGISASQMKSTKSDGTILIRERGTLFALGPRQAARQSSSYSEGVWLAGIATVMRMNSYVEMPLSSRNYTCIALIIY